MKTRDKILNLLKGNVKKEVEGKTISDLVKVQDWPRVLRNLRQEGWDISYNRKTNSYILNSEEKKDTGNLRVNINNKDRYYLLQRDNSTCQRCGATIADGIKLEIDHKIPVDWGGTNDIENLWVLCNRCNGGKKNLFREINPEIMKQVLSENSGYLKILRFFILQPNVLIEPRKIEIISGIRDYTRTIRLVRNKENLNIEWVPKDEEYPDGGYILKT
jgi:hypothetical protein